MAIEEQTIKKNEIDKETEERVEETIKIKEKVEESIKTEEIGKKSFIVKMTIIFVLLILLLLCTIFALVNINSDTIVKGVKINNFDISRMTKEEAMQKLNAKIKDELEAQIKLENEEWSYEFVANQIGANYEVEEAINKSYNIGRSGNVFKDNFVIAKALFYGINIEMDIKYNEEELENIITDIKSKLPDAVEEVSYRIEDNKLIIDKGHSGNSINEEEVKKLIIDKIENNDGNPINIEMFYKEANDIDIDKIYAEIYVKPKDAYYKKEPFEIFPHVNGIDFNIEDAKQIIQEDKEEYQIDLVITEPEILTSEIGEEAFPDLLSAFSTKYDETNKNRSTNLKLAGEKINGKVIMPGEIFSYNETLGKRTTAAGYKSAAGYSGGKVVQTIGGGICQISSTLYDAVVYANLEIVERHNHMFLTGYVQAGKDATVSYGGVDFKFKNTRKYPIMIKTNIKNGVAKIEIYGVKEDIEYEIEISSTVLNYISYKTVYEENSNLEPGMQKTVQGGKNGCRSITYKIYNLNGVEVSREVLSEDTYSAMNKIIQKGPEEVTVVEEPENIEEVVAPIEQEDNTEDNTQDDVA